MTITVPAIEALVLRVRDAKALFAATAAVAPWDFVRFEDGLGWGLTFPYGRFVSVRGNPEFLGPFQLLSLYLELGSQGVAGVAVTVAWITSVGVGVAAVAAIVYGRLRRGGTTRETDRRAGIVLVAAGLLFLSSRIAGATVLTWTSFPVGAVYVTFVGALFYRGSFRFGAAE